jgi:hypothetical protein
MEQKMSNLHETNRSVPAVSLVYLLLLGWATLAQAHGASGELIQGCLAVQATYDDGSPMAYCDVKVFGPGESSTARREGTTDPDGYYAFVPVEVGSWTIVVDDGMGHQTTVDLTVDSQGIVSEQRSHKTGRLSGGIVGVSIIFGLFGLYALIRARRTG